MLEYGLLVGTLVGVWITSRALMLEYGSLVGTHVGVWITSRHSCWSMDH